MNNKLSSLIGVFNEYELTSAILTETWFATGQKLERELVDLEEAENISVIKKNRNTRGGGVADAFDNKVLSLKEFKLPKNMFELVCAVGNFSSSNRKIAIIALYILPKQNYYQNEGVHY